MKIGTEICGVCRSHEPYGEVTDFTGSGTVFHIWHSNTGTVSFSGTVDDVRGLAERLISVCDKATEKAKAVHP